MKRAAVFCASAILVWVGSIGAYDPTTHEDMADLALDKSILNLPEVLARIGLLPLATTDIKQKFVSSGTDPVAFGAALRQERAAQRLSQERLAELSSVGSIYVSNVERGVYQPTIGTVLAFERALGLDPGELVRRAGQSLGQLDRRKRK